MADEPNRIQVQLDFLSAHESAAFKEMVSGIKVANEFMQAFKAADFATQAEKLTKAAKTMREETQKMSEVRRTGGLAGAVGQGIANMRQAVQGSDPRKANEERLRAERAAGEEHRAKEEKKLKNGRTEAQEKVRQAKLETMTDTERAAEHARERFAGKIPPSWEEQDPDAFYNEVESLTPDVKGLRIPQYGEITLQDLLGQARQKAQTKAEKAAQADDDDEYKKWGKWTKTADKASRAAGNVAGIHALFRQTQRHVTGPLQGTIDAFEAPGSALGFERQRALGFLPISTPFSPAGREGARQMWDIANMRFQGGINKEQAEAINQATTSAGFSGQAGTDIRRSLMAPAVQQMGVNPEALIPFTQTLRTGTSSITELNGVIATLGTGARNARMGIDEYTQAVTQSGEQAQATGGTFVQGAQFGEQFSSATGLSPQVGNQLLQNNVVKGYFSARTGLPGNLVGAGSPLAQQRSIEQALTDRVSAYQGSMPSHSEAIKDINGKVIGHEVTSGQDAAIGAAAQDLGIDQEQAKAMLKHKGGDNAANFQAMSRDYEQRASGGRNRDQTTDLGRAFADKLNDKDSNIGFVGRDKRRYNARTGKIEHKRGLGLGDWYVDEKATDKFEKKNFNVKDQLRNAEGTDLREMHETARAAGVSQKDWEKKVDKEKDPHKQAAAARKLVDAAVGEANDPNAIKFTGPAAKFFTALVKENKGLAGAGDLSKSAIATSNTGSAPLSNQSNAGGSFGGLDSTGG